MAATTVEPQWIDTDDEFASLVELLETKPIYGFDTEFHRERSYYPHLALIQLSWDEGVAVVDPLAVDITPIKRVLEGPGLAIVHAAEQDLEVLDHVCSTIPARMFDTQIAAAFCGLGFASLAKLVGALVGDRLPKGDRLTDWTRRPLDKGQIAYAASDVVYLLGMTEQLKEKAHKAGTLDWIEEECERVRTRPLGPPDPDAAWWKIKGSRSFRGSTRGVAQEVAGWRERLAAKRDIPPRFVLAELALSSIVQRGPRSREDLSRIRGLDGRALKGGAEQEILAAVERGEALNKDQLRLPTKGEPPLEDLGPTIALGQALIARISEDRGIEPSMLGSRFDVHSLAAGRTSGKLASGWRHEIAGRPLLDLLAGRLGITGNGKGGVRLIPLDDDSSS
ncbi:MAG: HRDC domain-containing protein [Candidatus Binatia bacterium]|nr:HRDC domain-containing protein [Candidatus Binatia bacterium]